MGPHTIVNPGMRTNRDEAMPGFKAADENTSAEIIQRRKKAGLQRARLKVLAT